MTEFFESGINLSSETIFSKCIIVKYGRLDKSSIQTGLCMIQDSNTLNQDKWQQKNTLQILRSVSRA